MILCRWASCSSVVSQQLILGKYVQCMPQKAYLEIFVVALEGGHLVLQSNLSHRPGIPTTLLLLHFKAVTLPPLPPTPPSSPLLSPWLVSPPWYPAGVLGLTVCLLFVHPYCILLLFCGCHHQGSAILVLTPGFTYFLCSLNYMLSLWASVFSSVKVRPMPKVLRSEVIALWHTVRMECLQLLVLLQFGSGLGALPKAGNWL